MVDETCFDLMDRQTDSMKVILIIKKTRQGKIQDLIDSGMSTTTIYRTIGLLSACSLIERTTKTSKHAQERMGPYYIPTKHFIQLTKKGEIVAEDINRLKKHLNIEPMMVE